MSRCGRRIPGPLLFALLLALFFAHGLAAADLLKLTPDDVGLCVQVTNLDRHVDSILASPLLNHFEQLVFFRDLEVSANLRKLLLIADGLSAQVGAKPEEIRRQLFGGELLLAVWPSAPTGDVLGRGLLMFEASDASLLTKLQSSLADEETGAMPDMDIRQPMHAGRAYVMRQIESEGMTRSLCFAALDKLAIVTGDESLMQRALELHAGVAKGSLAESESFQKSQTHVVERAPFHWYVQTRSWDELIREQTARLAPEQALLGAAAWEAWQHTDYVLLSLDPGRTFRVDSFLAIRHAELPAPLSTFAESLRGSCAFFQRVPDDALLALATHCDLRRAHRWLRSAQLREALGVGDALAGPRGEAGRQLQDFANGMFVGLELFEPLLAGLGPNLGGYLQPSRRDGVPAVAGTDSDGADDSAGQWGLQWLFSVQAGEEPMSDVLDLKRNLDVGLSTALRWMANLPGATKSRDGVAARVTRDEINGVEVTALEGARALPPGVVAAYAIAGDYLVAGTSSQGVAAAANPDAAQSLAASQRWQALAGPPGEAWGQQLYVDCRGLRTMAQDRRYELAQMISLWRRLRPETATKALDQLLWLIEPMEALALMARVEDDGVTLRFAAELAAEPSATGKAK